MVIVTSKQLQNLSYYGYCADFKELFWSLFRVPPVIAMQETRVIHQFYKRSIYVRTIAKCLEMLGFDLVLDYEYDRPAPNVIYNL